MHCITFTFSQYFMHYRCAFYMLEPCVLVRLDWVEPMMHFFFACHMIMHCSCIGTFSFPFWCNFFMVLFFLSPILYFSDSLRMTPKRKTTPSRNPLHFRALSSDPTPLHVSFYDKKAYQDFSKNFSKCGIHSECHVILSDFSDTNLPTITHR